MSFAPVPRPPGSRGSRIAGVDYEANSNPEVLIEHLRAEIERLTRKLEAEREECERRGALMIERCKEIERLRAALERYANEAPDWMKHIARAALARNSEESR